jgi:hypothetical protein
VHFCRIAYATLQITVDTCKYCHYNEGDEAKAFHHVVEAPFSIFDRFLPPKRAAIPVYIHHRRGKAATENRAKVTVYCRSHGLLRCIRRGAHSRLMH